MQNVETIVKQAIKGDNVAFTKLIEEKLKTIIYTSYDILGNYHDAEDVAQDVILKMHKYIHGLKDPSAINAWIKRMVINQCFTFKNKSFQRNEIAGTDEMFVDIKDEDREFLPQEYAENEDQRTRLKEIIQSLSEERRLIITMYYYDDMSLKDIAYALDKSIGHVTSAISRARDTIKKELEKSS
jgi:RNA polymerase sigma-70 factor (ECF subfamily)